VEARPGRLVFLSGQIPLDPRTGELVTGDISVQTERVMENLGAVLRAASLGFQDVVRCTIYLVDLAEFTTVNGVYGRYFPASPPARATVQVAALPRGARVEIDAVAVG
jgi:2-iminobutanoate/2-iminopropanoate deaminase